MIYKYELGYKCELPSELRNNERLSAVFSLNTGFYFCLKNP